MKARVPMAYRHHSGRVSPKLPLPSFDDIPLPAPPPSLAGVIAGLGTGTMQVAGVGVDDTGEGWVSKTDTTSYSPGMIYLRSTNRNDHSTTIRLNIAPEVGIAIDSVCNRVAGLSNRSEFVRDAIIHRLWTWAEELGDELDSDWHNALTLETLMAVGDAMRVQLAKKTELIEQARETLQAVKDTGEVEAMDEALEYYGVIADQLPAPWDGRLHRVVNRMST